MFHNVIPFVVGTRVFVGGEPVTNVVVIDGAQYRKVPLTERSRAGIDMGRSWWRTRVSNHDGMESPDAQSRAST